MLQSTGREPIEGDAALLVLDGVTDLYVAKGKKTLHFDLMKQRPTDAELLEVLLGRSGKLRAPAIKVSGRLLVGYNDSILAEHLP